MKRRTCAVVFAALVCSGLAGKSSAQIPAEVSGIVGGGVFLPTGADRNVVGNSPALQLAASVGFLRYLGAEAELLYAHFFLREDALSAFAKSSGSQITAVGGIRATTGRTLGNPRPLTGYLSLRAGVARETIRATSPQIRPTPQSQPGAWVGRSVDILKSPPSGSGASSSDAQRGFVIAPKAGLRLRVSHSAAFDLAFQPMFIFHQRHTTAQFFLTLGIALSSWEIF